MKQITNQQLIRLDYEQMFAAKVKRLVEMRKKLRINQTELASFCSCSLRKIQLFETHRSMDAFLLYAYKQKLNKS